MSYQTFDVAVRGGKLRVGQWGHGPPVLGIHGVTASHMSWGAIVAELGESVTFIAPDLRGRGESAGLPGPVGITTHLEDCLAVLDHLGIKKVPVVGQSMGAWVAELMAAEHPVSVESLLLLDGGVVLPIPPGIEPEQYIEVALAPWAERLSKTFASRDEYFAFWKETPVFAEPGAWNEYIEAYFDYDLTGKEPKLKSKASIDAVRDDGWEQLTNPEVRGALSKISCPVHLIQSPRGLQNEPAPALPDFLVEEMQTLCPQMTVEMTEDNNHYTLMTGKAGAGLIANRIREAAQVG